MNGKRQFFKGALCGALIMLCLTGAVLGIGGCAADGIGLGGNAAAGTGAKLKVINRLLDKYYLRADEVDEEALKEGIYAGYVSGVDDPYTVYYTKEQTDELFESVSGEYSGIGAAMTQNYNTKLITVSKVYEGQPADEAGVKEGDILYQVDDREITDEDLSEVVTWIKGEEGTEVKLGIVRDGKELTLTAVRRKVEVQTVEYEMKEGQIGYILVTEFDDVTYKQFETALAELENQGMQGLVIDLRSNPGGSLDTVVSMLQLILPEGNIVSTVDRDGNETSYSSDGKHEFTKPLAVLVNQYSASASEIFAGAVKDYGIGEIVGVTTFGKGVVQQIFSLHDGSSLKVTISEYFTPKGNKIDGIGVAPDVEIEYEPDEENPEYDNQLEKALETVRK